jgi:glyoxylase-like metal-dependent hydrolase (beta-lactamase superfamily II)
LDVLIQPVVLRFSLAEDEIVYHFAGGADAQLDRMEQLMGIDPAESTVFDSNLGFLPVSTAVLIRADHTIVVDPGNHHTGFYGQLRLALRRFGLEPGDVDTVVATHCHHDHMASIVHFPGAELVMGAGELDFAREAYGPDEVVARLAPLGQVSEVPTDGELQLCAGIRLVSTPGHTPGHVSVVCDTDHGRVVVAGDAAMTRGEYERGEHSMWYEQAQLGQVKDSVARLSDLDADLVMPGHDRAFRPETRR